MVSSIASQFKYDVFLSCLDFDVRRGLVCHLIKALSAEQIETFDSTKLEVGDEILPSLLRAIEGSQISLIMFSKYYASSKLCLIELAKIFERAEKAQTAIPMFYDVDPSEVRHQKGNYGHAFEHHERERSEREARKWREALTMAANLSGFCSSRHGSDAELIDAIVKFVLKKLYQLCHNNTTGDDDEGSFGRTIASWQKGEILGRGSYGSVYEGFTTDGFLFAVKEVCLKDEGSQAKQCIFQLQQEILFLSRFQHENIVQYFGTGTDNNMLYIFLELVTKRSLERLYKTYSLTDSQVSSYTRQILSGLKYLHDQDVIHRDIKCANILLDKNGTIKLADFGLAKETKFNSAKTSIGSLCWMAPEVANPRHRSYGPEADIWSLGCTTLEMLTRKPPYSPFGEIQALLRIGRGQPPPIPESLSIDARDFIRKCLKANPSKRPTAAQLLDHPFVKRPSLS